MGQFYILKIYDKESANYKMLKLKHKVPIKTIHYKQNFPENSNRKTKNNIS